MENISTYYGIDWAAIILGLYAVYLLGNKRKIGFIYFSISNALWIILGVFYMSSYGMAIGNLAFLLINIRGYIQWHQESIAKA